MQYVPDEIKIGLETEILGEIKEKVGRRKVGRSLEPPPELNQAKKNAVAGEKEKEV